MVVALPGSKRSAPFQIAAPRHDSTPLPVPAPTWKSQTGPAVIDDALNAYRKPFLLQAVTISVGVPPSVAWNTVGDAAQSLSSTCWAAGILQPPVRARVVAFRLTMDDESPGNGAPLTSLPVVTNALPLASTAGLDQMLPPSCAAGIVRYVCCSAPVPRAYALSPAPATSGWSHCDAMPM